MTNRSKRNQKSFQRQNVRNVRSVESVEVEALLLAGRDIKRMEEGARKLERFAKKVVKQGLPKGWNSTEELHKLRYGKFQMPLYC